MCAAEQESGIEEGWEELSEFVEKYGPPLQDSLDDFVLEYAMEEAALMAAAVACYQSLGDPGRKRHQESVRCCLRGLLQGHLGERAFSHSGYVGFRGTRNLAQITEIADVGTESGLLQVAGAWTQDVINHSPNALSNVRPLQVFVPDVGWVQRYSFGSLASAMRLQLHWAMIAHSPFRECQSCARVFEAQPRSRRYCDPFCRDAAASRRYYDKHVRARAARRSR